MNLQLLITVRSAERSSSKAPRQTFLTVISESDVRKRFAVASRSRDSSCCEFILIHVPQLGDRLALGRIAVVVGITNIRKAHTIVRDDQLPLILGRHNHNCHSDERALVYHK
jgi:hypothetical protein